jgi:hypothetical protein
MACLWYPLGTYELLEKLSTDVYPTMRYLFMTLQLMLKLQ